MDKNYFRFLSGSFVSDRNRLWGKTNNTKFTASLGKAFLVLMLCSGLSVFGQINKANSAKGSAGLSVKSQQGQQKQATALSVLSEAQTVAESSGNKAVVSENNGVSENQSPFEAVKGKKEIAEKRDMFSKTYQNQDGSFTALIGAGPIHYQKNGQFLDIDTKIVQNPNFDFPHANTTNLMESYFGATAHKGVKSKTAEGEVIEFLNAKMYWEANGQALQVQNAANTTAVANNDKLTYPNIYGNISAEYQVLATKRELNYIIPAKQSLGNIPAGVDYLVFSEDILLPLGWTATTVEQGILIKDNLGKNIYLYDNPVSKDNANALPDNREKNTIFESIQLGQLLTVKTKVKTEWLLSNERVYPVMVDPTTNVTPNNATNWSRSVYNDGDNETTGYFGNVANYWLSYFVKFNTSTITPGSTVSAVVGYRNQTGYAGTRNASSQWNWANCADPTTTSGTALYNSQTALQGTSANTNNTNGWKTVTFTASGRTYVSNGINNNGYVAAAVYAAGTWNTSNYYANADHTNANRPYLAVTYTVPAGPPPCATVIRPANDSTAQAHQQLLAWNASSGATGYDVYFGTSAGALTKVATNQSGTTYAITDCLLPLTTYYWRIDPRNANGIKTGCTVWNFTTDNKIHLYENDFDNASPGFFGTSGTSVDGWYTNNNIGTGGTPTSGYNNTWTVGDGTYAISGMSAGVTALQNGALAASHFMYWEDLGEIHRWIYRPFNMTGIRDIELNFRWKCGGENNQDFGVVATSINGGANWLTDDQGGLYNDGKYWNSPSTIRNQTIIFPESRNNQSNFQLAFKWDDLSGNGYSSYPSFVVDDIVLKGCPAEGNIGSTSVPSGTYSWTPTGSTATTLSVPNTMVCAQYQWEQSTNSGVNWTNISGAVNPSYTTPSNLTVETWYRAKVYFSTGCPGVYQDEPFKILMLPSCEPVTTSASDPVICAGETTTLTATSSTIGYTYTWYTNWDNDTHTGYVVGTGPSINVNPTESTLYGVVATKAGCPTGVNAAYSLITVAVTPAPELVILDPVEAIACSNEFEQISVVGGGGIPNEAFYENWDTTNINWISKVSVEDIVGDDNLNNAHWMLMSSDSILASPDNSDFTIVGSMFYEDSGDYLMESQLISPPISLLDYNTPVNLTFNHAFWTDGYSEAYVDISTDGGQTWTELKSYTSDVGGPTNFVGETINLNAYAGNPYVLIRFYYLSLWDEWFWAVDDIKITGSPKPTTVTWMVKDSNPVSYAGLYTNASGTTQYTGGHATTLYASPASTTTYTVAASTAVGCPAETEVTVERGDKEWQNTGNTNWNLTSNWNEGGIPTADHCVKIPSMAETRWPVVTSGVHGVAKNVTIQSGGGLTIKGGGSLTVTDIVNNQSSATDNFVIESNANLIQTNDVANTGQVKVEKQFTFSGERKQYNFVSVPVKDADPAGNPSYIKNTIYTPNPTSVQQYNTATYYFDEVNGKYISAKGYAVKEPANPTSPMGIFRGIPFNGHLNYLLSASGGRYNLVGNPYPSNIDLFKLYNDVKNSGANKNNIESNFYFWDNRGNAQFTQQGNDYGTTGYAPSQYAYFNAASGPVGTGVAAPAYSMGNGAGGRIPDRYAKVATGFIVQTKEGVSNPSLNFENDYRTKDGSVSFFGKTMEEPVSDRYWLTMTAPAGISVMNAVVYFEGGLDAYATDDTETFAPDDDLYTIVDGIQCVIQSKRPFTKTDQVPLGYRAFAPGYHYISVYQKEGVFDNGQDIYVIDKVLNKTWNISKEPYRFLTKSGEYNDRFLIVYKPQLTEGGTFAKNEIELVKQNGNIVITSSIDKITNVEIFDLSSRPVYKKSAVNARDFSVNALQFNHQIIVVSVKTETGEVVSKKFVNK